jgi:N-methylhydantoinase A
LTTALQERDFGRLCVEISAVLGEIEAQKEGLRFERFADLRYQVQVHTIKVPMRGWDHAGIAGLFEELHETLFGTRLGSPVEVVNLGVSGILPLPKPELRASAGGARGTADTVVRIAKVVLERSDVPGYARSRLNPGDKLVGACMVEEEDFVAYLPSGTSASVDEFGNIVCAVPEPTFLGTERGLRD